jgi:hypothetical protein
VLQPTVSAALCLLGVDCQARYAYLRDTLRFAIANDGHQPLLGAAVRAAGLLATSGREDAWGLLLDAADGAPEAARETISIGLAEAALESPDLMIAVLERRTDVAQVAELLLEGFDILSEELAEERFGAEIRRAYWSSPAGSPRRAVVEALIRKLEF